MTALDQEVIPISPHTNYPMIWYGIMVPQTNKQTLFPFGKSVMYEEVVDRSAALPLLSRGGNMGEAMFVTHTHFTSRQR